MIAFDDEVALVPAAFENGRGQRLFALRSAPVERESRGLVLLPPGYERRPHHYSVVSRYLVRHGYSTMRFDLSNHIGLSDGEILDFTMSSMTGDIAAVAAGCLDEAGGALSVVASSLGARAVVRALARDQSLQAGVGSVVLILPVIDTEYTTAQAIGRNLLDDWRCGRVVDPATTWKVLNHTVSFEFAHDALSEGFDGEERTQAELASIDCPVTAIAAERDDWVRVEDVERAMAVDAPRRRETVVLEATSHDFSSNAPVVRALLSEVLAALAIDAGEEPPPLQSLEFDEVLDTVTTERRLKVENYRGAGAMR